MLWRERSVRNTWLSSSAEKKGNGKSPSSEEERSGWHVTLCCCSFRPTVPMRMSTGSFTFLANPHGLIHSWETQTIRYTVSIRTASYTAGKHRQSDTQCQFARLHTQLGNTDNQIHSVNSHGFIHSWETQTIRYTVSIRTA